jgi:hypothetical protein
MKRVNVIGEALECLSSHASVVDDDAEAISTITANLSMKLR